MAGLKSVLQVVPLLEQGLGLVTRPEISASQKSQAVALEQLQARQANNIRAAEADANEKRASIALSAQTAEEDRKRALRRAVARQRSQFGAQGIGTSGGSGQAVLLGLFDESQEDKAQRKNLDALRLGAIDQNLSQARSLNVLQRSQLQQRQKVSNLSARANRPNFASNLAGGAVGIYDDLGDIFS